jgi:hypothetical protein
MHFLFGFSDPRQTFESAKSPVTCASISVIATLPWLAAVIFFALLFAPDFAVKLAELGETVSVAATVGIGVGVKVVVAVGVAVAVLVGVGETTGVRTVLGVADTVGVAVSVAVAV